MAKSFAFDTILSSQSFVGWADASTGAGVFNGIDDATRFHMVGYDRIDSSGDEAVVAIALNAGQTVLLDLDFGAGDADSIDAEVTVIDANGTLVASNDDSGALDPGSVSTLDPRLSFTAATTGLYYIAVAHFVNNYISGTFRFQDDGTDFGDFQLDISVSGATLPAAPVVGDEGDNVIGGGGGADRILGLGGNDTITAGGGNNYVDGGGGFDHLTGGSGFDQLFGGRADDILSGGSNADVLVGGQDDDIAFGGTGNDQLFGGDDDDQLNGNEGNDQLRGEDGDDFLNASSGDDIVNGGTGIDTVTYVHASGSVTVDLKIKTLQATGAGGNDTITFVENLEGSNFSDSLTGSGDANVITCRNGNDNVNAQGGNDIVFGDNGDDILNGSAGEDIIVGGGQDDDLTGGTGLDIFRFFDGDSGKIAATRDIVTDFSVGADILDLQGMDAKSAVLGNQAFTFIGAAAFSGVAGQLQSIVGGGITIVSGDTNGDSLADFQIELSGSKFLSEPDFVL